MAIEHPTPPASVAGRGVATPARRVPKPWGEELIWQEAEYTAKTLSVRAGHRLSLQLHTFKTETMFVHAGHPTITLGGEDLECAPGDVVHIPAGTIHRLAAPDDDVLVFEVSTSFPDDITRFSDDYGR